MASCSPWHRAPPAFSSLGPFLGLSSPPLLSCPNDSAQVLSCAEKLLQGNESPCYQPGPQVRTAALPGGLASDASPSSC